MTEDGCESDCTYSKGWICTDGVCLVVCGDGAKMGEEECDDSNLIDGDGCSKICEIESGWVCSGGTCTSICGDGFLIR